MSDLAKFSAGWTEPELWAWEQIAAGEPADFNARDRRYYSEFTWEQIAAGEPADFNARDERYYSEFSDLDPCNENGWAENRRLRVKFLQDILTKKVFADATPDAGVRILGALVDDVPLNLEHTRLRRLIWLEHSRILTDVKCRNLRVDGEFSLEGSFVGGRVELWGANIGSVSLDYATFKPEVDLASISIDANLGMSGATFEGKVDLNAAKVGRSAFFRKGTTCKAEVDLIGADIGFNLEMDGSTFEGKVDLSSAKVGGSAYLRDGATFKDVGLVSASIDANLDMSGATFEGKVNLNAAKVGGTAFLSNRATFKEVALIGASIDANLDMSGATFEGKVNLNAAKVGGTAFLSNRATFKEVALIGASIDANLDMSGATFEDKVDLNSAKVGGWASLRDGAFKDVDLVSASIDANLDMSGATFEGKVDLNSAKVGGWASLRKGAFKDVDLVSASIDANLDMSGATFEGKVDLNSAKVGGWASLRKGAFKDVDLVSASIDANLDMSGATFEGKVDLSSAKVGGTAFLSDRATFNEVDFKGADIGSDLDFSDATVAGRGDMTGCQVKRELRLGSFGHQPARLARWEPTALLVLRNAHVGALQDWWRNSSENSWPKALELEGFTFDRLGGLFGTGEESDMMARPSSCYVEWLGKDSGSSAQPYEHLASLFRRAGDPDKANDLLFAARERRRRLALSGGELLRGWGLWMLKVTIGYGLGNHYFRVLWWVGGWSLLGMFVLKLFGTQSPALWPPLSLFFASLDQLLPIITLNKAYDVLIFGDPSAKLDPQPPWVLPQPFWVQVYFYVHMMVGWVLGSFIVAGLAGLTQRN